MNTTDNGVRTPQLSDILLPELEAELGKTRRALERVPEGHNDFRPHPKSMSLIELANHLATVAGLPAAILLYAGADLGGPTDPRRIVKEQTCPAVIGEFEKLAASSIGQLKVTAEEAFSEPWRATRQGSVLFSGTRYMAYRNIAINHLIHHRAQLGVYLRMLDVAVPSSFGPSADEQPR